MNTSFAAGQGAFPGANTEEEILRIGDIMGDAAHTAPANPSPSSAAPGATVVVEEHQFQQPQPMPGSATVEARPGTKVPKVRPPQEPGNAKRAALAVGRRVRARWLSLAERDRVWTGCMAMALVAILALMSFAAVLIKDNERKTIQLNVMTERAIQAETQSRRVLEKLNYAEGKLARPWYKFW